MTRPVQRRDAEPAPEEPRAAAVLPPAPQRMLDPQRTAGNAAVARVLAREPMQ